MYLIKLKEEQLRKLYELKAVKKKPITKMVQEAVEGYLKSSGVIQEKK